MSLKSSFVEIEIRGYRDNLWEDLTDLGEAILNNVSPDDLHSIKLSSSNTELTFEVVYDKDGTGTGSVGVHVWQYDMRGYVNKEDFITRESDKWSLYLDPANFIDFVASVNDNMLIYLWIYRKP